MSDISNSTHAQLAEHARTEPVNMCEKVGKFIFQHVDAAVMLNYLSQVNSDSLTVTFTYMTYQYASIEGDNPKLYTKNNASTWVDPEDFIPWYAQFVSAENAKIGVARDPSVEERVIRFIQDEVADYTIGLFLDDVSYLIFLLGFTGSINVLQSYSLEFAELAGYGVHNPQDWVVVSHFCEWFTAYQRKRYESYGGEPQDIDAVIAFIKTNVDPTLFQEYIEIVRFFYQLPTTEKLTWKYLVLQRFCQNRRLRRS
jgi:hypothetical protein